MASQKAIRMAARRLSNAREEFQLATAAAKVAAREAHEEGFSKLFIASTLGITRPTLDDWLK